MGQFSAGKVGQISTGINSFDSNGAYVLDASYKVDKTTAFETDELKDVIVNYHGKCYFTGTDSDSIIKCLETSIFGDELLKSVLFYG